MPHASHRLDLALVSGGERLDRVAMDALVRDLLEASVLAPAGRPGEQAADMVPGGFARWRVDDPGHVVLYANQQGGFRVCCPACGANLVPAFHDAYRHGAGASVTCEACGTVTGLPALDFQPAAAFGPGALVLADVRSASLTDEGRARVEAKLGRIRVVRRRVG